MSPRAKNVIADAVADIDRDELATTANKSERIEIRATPRQKEEIQRIAESLGLSAAEYLLGLHGHAYPILVQRRK